MTVLCHLAELRAPNGFVEHWTSAGRICDSRQVSSYRMWHPDRHNSAGQSEINYSSH
jgi:hypothetical protein